MLKVAITGPESSGKTTLTKMLAAHFSSPYALEYARIYLEAQNGAYNKEDLDIMAKGQLALWEKVTKAPIAFYDTEFMVFYIWSMERYNSVSPFIQHELNAQQFDLYLICSPDIPWEFDPLRENELDRTKLFEAYVALAKRMNYPYYVINGDYHERLSQVIQRVEHKVV